MLFFTGNAEARAHDTAPFAPALANANTAEIGVSEAAVILRKFEVSCRLPWLVICSEPQIFVEPVRINQLARIHLPVGIPNGLEFAKGLHDFSAEHAVEQLSTGLAVTVLS